MAGLEFSPIKIVAFVIVKAVQSEKNFYDLRMFSLCLVVMPRVFRQILDGEM